MTFTFSEALDDDISRVRFYIYDRVEADARVSDELITGLIGEEGSWQKAAIALLDDLIMQYSSTPDTRADWLQISYGGSVDALRKRKYELQQRFGLGVRIRGRVLYPRLTHSDQTEPPDYE